MSISFGMMRKKLEQEQICDSLKGRIQYFATRYRKTHDSEGGVAVRVDGKEVLRSDFFKWVRLMYQQRSPEEFESKSWQEIDRETVEKGGFDQYAFYKAFYEYINQSIDMSLHSQNAIVRLFAVMDKRTGKRTLQSLASEMAAQPEWLAYFYRLRMDAENILYDTHSAQMRESSTNEPF